MALDFNPDGESGIRSTLETRIREIELKNIKKNNNGGNGLIVIYIFRNRVYFNC